MALKLKQGPLANRIDPPKPRRHWVWTDPGQYHAVYSQNETALLWLLRHPGRLLRLVDGGYCLIFNDPVTLDPAKTAALPLRRVGAESFVSYQSDKTPVRGLSIISQGAPKLLSLEGASLIDPISFWNFDQMPVIEGRPVPASKTTLPKVAKPKKDDAPQLNKNLQIIAKQTEFFEDVRSKAAEAVDPRHRALVGETGHFIVRLLASVALILIYIMVITTTLSLAGNIGPLGFLLAAVFLAWYFGILGSKTVGIFKTNATGARQKTGQQTGQQTGRARRQSSGLLDTLRGLTLWNTPLGDNLRREIQRQLDQVNSMIDRGDIDRALKRAMSLAREESTKQKRKNRLMTAPPKPRGSLDFNYGRNDDDVVSLPGNWDFESLRAKYQKLAEDLSAQGDHKRAAFVYAELLDMVKPALAELEKIKSFDEAAKLATARNEEGPVIARLWFLAGQKEIALLIARRHNCMDKLAAFSAKDPEFSAFVRMHWIEDLITEGNLPRAVQESADNPRLAETHLRVLGKAIGAEHLHDHPVLEYAVQSLPWPIDALSVAQSDQSVGGQIAAVVNAGVTQPEAGETRHALIRAAKRMGKDDPRKPALADAVIRASLAFDMDTPFMLSTNELRRFAQDQGCPALAEDLRQIHRSDPLKPHQNMHIPLPQSGHGTWTMVAALQRGAALVGTQSGEVALIDPKGVKRWVDHLSDLVGMVPIGAGRLVLLVQGHDANRQLSLLDTAHHSYRSLGSIKLVAWDHYAGEGVWQIQTPDAIGALDLTKLIAEEPQFEMLWSITQTIPVKVIAFHNNQSGAEWLTQRLETHGPGLLEKWNLYQPTLRLSVILESKNTGQEMASVQHIWRGTQFSPLILANAATSIKHFHGMQSNLEQEQILTADIGDDLIARESFADITPVPHGAAYAEVGETTGRSIISLINKETKLLAKIEGEEIIAQSATRNGNHLVVLTESGLVILCDFQSLSVLAV
ncbi:MAG: hypothetical protein ABJH45_02555 [Paracoccaceae bacterium]